MVSQVLCADFDTRNLRPQNASISGMKGRASRFPLSSSVARISSALRTSIQSPARRSGDGADAISAVLTELISFLRNAPLLRKEGDPVPARRRAPRCVDIGGLDL